MASINSVTGSLSSTASLRGYGGLSSGLDRDGLIESLTYGTRSKIEAQQAKKEKMEWEQTIIRGMIDKVYDFTSTYASYTSTTNLASSAFFARSSVEAIGDNSKYVSVSGVPANADLFSVVGVKQLAQDARLAGGTASASQLTTGTVKFDEDVNIDQLEGKYISFKVGSETYYADMGAIDLSKYANGGADAALQEVLQKALDNTEAGKGKLSDSVGVSVSGGIVAFAGKGGNAVEITGGDALKKLGFSDDETYTLTAGKTAVGAETAKPVDTVEAKTYMAGKSLTFNYNGTAKSITIGSNITNITDLQKDLQSKLDSAFGKGRISVGTKDGALTFTTTIPDGDNNSANNAVDATSTLSITGGAKGFLGDENSVFGMKSGASNRVDLSKNLKDAGLANAGALKLTDLRDGSGDKGYSMIINGERFAFKEDASIQEIIDTVNKSNAGVKISYSKDADKFTIESTERGASGQIEMYGGIAEALFGSDLFVNDTGTSWKSAKVSGQDAIIAVKYAGASEATEIRRDSNSFTMDGLTVSVNGTFGYQDKTVQNADGTSSTVQELIGDSEAVTFKASTDVDKLMKGITDMVNAYNEIVALINSELKSKPDKDYSSPLTATQKEDMTEDEIKEYESSARKGLLFGDNDLRSFANELRYVLAGSDLAKLAEIGITESTEYSDNGKLVIDEAKLKAALEKDPEAVGELFAGKDNADGTSTAGFVDNMKAVFDKYCNTMGATKGLLVQRAGSDHSPLSLLDNTMKTEMDNIADYIETLLDRLEAEEDRYIRQFTSLESLISEMNSQSSYLSSLSGY